MARRLARMPVDCRRLSWFRALSTMSAWTITAESTQARPLASARERRRRGVVACSLPRRKQAPSRQPRRRLSFVQSGSAGPGSPHARLAPKAAVGDTQRRCPRSPRCSPRPRPPAPLAAWEAENQRRAKREEVPLEAITLQEGRRTCASLLIAAGVNPKAIPTGSRPRLGEAGSSSVASRLD
jgi:hypothetical protein